MNFFLRILAKYLLIFIGLFIACFCGIYFYHFLIYAKIPELALKNNQFHQSLLLFSVYLSFFISLLLSILIFGIFFIQLTQKPLLYFIIPILMTEISIAVLFIFFPLSQATIKLKPINHASLFLTEKTFIKYDQGVPQYLSNSEYKQILAELSQLADKKNFSRSYQKTLSNQYELNEETSQSNKRMLVHIFNEMSASTNDKIFYFGRITRQDVYQVIFITRGQVHLFEHLPLEFKDDNLLLKIPGPEGKAEIYLFTKLSYIYQNILNLPNIKMIYSNLCLLLNDFLKIKPLPLKLLFWFCFSLFLLTFSHLINIKVFPFFTVLLNIIIVFFLFVLLYFVYINFKYYFFTYWACALLLGLSGLKFLIAFTFRQSKKEEK